MGASVDSGYESWIRPHHAADTRCRRSRRAARRLRLILEWVVGFLSVDRRSLPRKNEESRRGVQEKGQRQRRVGGCLVRWGGCGRDAALLIGKDTVG